LNNTLTQTSFNTLVVTCVFLDTIGQRSITDKKSKNATTHTYTLDGDTLF